MSKKSGSTSGGIGFIGLLTLVFIVLKLIDEIDWSWWWVLSPLWIAFSAAILFLVIFVVITVLIKGR